MIISSHPNILTEIDAHYKEKNLGCLALKIAYFP